MTNQGNVKKLAASITYIIFFWPFLTGTKGDIFVNYHFKQSVGLVIAGLIGQGVISVLGWWGLGYGPAIFLIYALRILLIVGVILGIKNASAGNTKPLPWIGNYAEKF